MRILFVITSSTLCDGIAQHILTLAKNLSKNVEIGLCITHDPGELGTLARLAGVVVYSLQGAHGHDYRIFKNFKTVLQEFKPDLIHAHVLPFLSGIYLIFFQRKIPLVVTIHGISDSTRSGKWWKDCLLNLYNSLLYRRIIRSLMISRPVQEWYRKTYPKDNSRQIVCYNPISINSLPKKERDWLLEELKLPSDTVLIGMIGRLAEVKDWFSFIKICNYLCEKNNYHFISVGSGPLENELKNNELVIKSSEKFHWLGYRSDAKRVIGALDICMLTSYREGMPTVVLESFGMRTPIAGFVPEGGVQEILLFEKEMGGRLAALSYNRNCRKAAEEIIYLIENPEEKNAQVDRAYSLVRLRFDASEICKELEKIYRDVLSECGDK